MLGQGGGQVTGGQRDPDSTGGGGRSTAGPLQAKVFCVQLLVILRKGHNRRVGRWEQRMEKDEM